MEVPAAIKKIISDELSEISKKAPSPKNHNCLSLDEVSKQPEQEETA